MGREIKRVPLNFSWPLNVVWGGYINPFYKQSAKCPQCDGSGATAQFKDLEDRWYGKAPFRPEQRGSKPWLPTDGPVRRLAEHNVSKAPEFYGSGESSIVREAHRLCDLFNSQWSHHLNSDDVAALVASDRLRDLTHTWSKEKGWQPKSPAVIPTPQQVNEWSLSGFGHDSCNCWIVCEAESKRLGIETTCHNCNGEGSIWPTPDIKQLCEDWKSTEPPSGDGYQLWETVSEGSPISPVFSSPEELAAWLATSPDYRWRKNDAGTTQEQWLRFINGPGWAPSLIASDRGIETGVRALSKDS